MNNINTLKSDGDSKKTSNIESKLTSLAKLN